jgi:phosphoadenosine phosphosulfate reductase
MHNRSSHGGTILYDTLKTASKLTDRILVGVSGGKDSAVTLDLCSRFFKHVTGYFMYLVKGLEFQENTLRHYERRYGIEIKRVPHFMLSEWLRYGTLRQPDFDIPVVSTKETYDYVRDMTGIWWIACGERISDSIIRRAMIKHSGTIDEQRGRVYPIAYWNKPDIMYYVKRERLRLSAENEALGFSFRSLMPHDLQLIKQRFPSDYEKIKLWFPLVEASRLQDEYYGSEKTNDEKR